MIKKQFFFLLLSSFYVHALLAQFGFSPQEVKQRLQTDIRTLSSDEYEGREAGTAGERKAAGYIMQRMKEAGISPMFDGEWMQAFTFQGEWAYGENNTLKIGNRSFNHGVDFYTLPNSANGSMRAKGIYVGYGLEEEAHDDYKDIRNLTNITGRIFFMEYYLPEHMDHPTNHLAVLQKKIEKAISKGARAVVFVNTSASRRDPSTSLNQQLGREGIPVLFARTAVLEAWKRLSRDANIELSTDLNRENHTSYNVAGYIDNNAPYTIVIGGHYDHMGYGGRGSRSPGVRAIHPGADDNASGTAGVMEAARFVKQSPFTNYNYIFIAFSAEEKGLLGSRHFTVSDAYDMKKVNYMLNFDMLGRVENNTFSLIGTGSSPVWDSIIEKHTPEAYTIKKSPGGTGGSDHTSFYRQNIPVLFFFSGLHDDYHRPSDTEDKINYEGLLTMLQFGYDLVGHLDEAEKIPFTETAVIARESRRPGVVLGLMPDHTFEGDGLKIQAVSQNNPAQKAGIAGGDVIIKIGETRINDINTYMQALGTLKPNDSVKVRIIREGKELEFNVTL
jgi:aminopeptidase YwaD